MRVGLPHSTVVLHGNGDGDVWISLPFQQLHFPTAPARTSDLRGSEFQYRLIISSGKFTETMEEIEIVGNDNREMENEMEK